MTLGVLVPEIAEGYTALVLAGLEQGLQQAGYVYILISHHHRDEVVERSLRMLAERAVDGLVAIDTALPDSNQLPTVTISCADGHEDVTSILLDHAKAAELAIAYLVAEGHRRLAVIKGQVFSSDTQVRWKSICTAAQKHSLFLDPALVVQLEEDLPTHEPGYLAAQKLLTAGRPFTAIFAFNDISAIGAIRAVREAGLEVPKDISVIGFDDIPSAAFQHPGLTTVRQPLRQMGRLAAETIIAKVTNSIAGPAILHVDPELVIRESVASVSATDALPESA